VDPYASMGCTESHPPNSGRIFENPEQDSIGLNRALAEEKIFFDSEIGLHNFNQKTFSWTNLAVGANLESKASRDTLKPSGERPRIPGSSTAA